MKLGLIFPLLLVIVVSLLIGCQQTETKPVSKVNTDSQTKALIENAAREFWAQRRPTDKINGYSYQKFSDSIYLVAVTFEGQQTNAINAVARRFENGDQVSWKIEPFNERWQGILRLEPEK